MSDYIIDFTREFFDTIEAKSMDDAISDARDIVRGFRFEDKYELVNIQITNDDTGETQSLEIKAREVQ